MNNKALQLALYPDADNRWIAGVLYAQTITRAISTLSETERPKTHLIIRRKSDGPHYTALRQSVTSTRLFDHNSAVRLSKRFKNWRRAVFKKQTPPLSLQDCIKQTNVDLIMPCWQSLGPKFKLPWIGWIPDFQHKHLAELFAPQELLRRDQQFQELIDDATHMIVSSPV